MLLRLAQASSKIAPARSSTCTGQRPSSVKSCPSPRAAVCARLSCKDAPLLLMMSVVRTIIDSAATARTAVVAAPPAVVAPFRLSIRDVDQDIGASGSDQLDGRLPVAEVQLSPRRTI
jgi:hypothetical protein